MPKLPSFPLGTKSFPRDYEVVRIATLNKTDLAGGNNKFYTIEAQVSRDGTAFRLYSRYGRVGVAGVEEERWPQQSRHALDEAFDALLAEKTSSRKGYVEVKLASSKVGSAQTNGKILSDDVKVTVTPTSARSKTTPGLEPSVAGLVVRLYNEAGSAVRRQLSGSLKTSAENPLGTLTRTQIGEGRNVLQEIHELLTRDPNVKGTINYRVLDLSNRFYSAIPQVMDRRPRPGEGKAAMDTYLASMALNDEKRLDEKEDLLALLEDVQGTVQGFASDEVTDKYAQIGARIDVAPADVFNKVRDFVLTTRSRHHSWKAEVHKVWRVSVKAQADCNVPTMQKVGHVVPLFHGSRPANILGICKHGILIRPPGVYFTGAMFGNGAYFADQSSKSEQYSMARFGGGAGHGSTFFIFVADVALGKSREYTAGQPGLTKPPAGYDSVMGRAGSALLHNEFIVYNVRQHVLQYLIEFST